MKRLILFSAILFSLISCKKYKPFEIDCTLSRDSSLASKYIKGTWEWIEDKSFSQIRGEFIFETPRNRGYVLRMIVSDSTLSWYVNAEKTDYKYKIQNTKMGRCKRRFFSS